ncbi:YbjN domain-containing protein [uncultured Sphingomonas sp.]|uniref:YbjN domain-containing protein n=1 Tax=uncultured Sphingomonas sp. TaxID=158754 RepID=UPI0025E25B1A|nr:YbjN domain-containing protein [uncultured Sphingomonas sp.]
MIGMMMGVAAAIAAPDAALLDLRQPGNVVTALHAAGYKAEMKINKDGEPYVLSATNGESFSVEFYGCDGLKDCKSFQLTSWYKKEPLYTPALTNEWNARNRFLKIAVDSDGDLREFLDATAVGGMTQAQFTDLVEWYSAMDGQLAQFLSAKRDAAGTKPAK